jgi:hydrogenase nickel incorporation protein HypB
MCATCGCSTAIPHSHDGFADHRHEHEPASGSATETITLEQRVLAKNDQLAQRNRTWLEARDVRAVNMMSSPGAGKTTLLVRTICDIGRQRPIYVVEGDQETSFDADRISASGAPVLQLNTGSGCHLDASQVATALRNLDPTPGGLVIVENIGNLVCPALFDLGEDRRVVVISVTEGDDKPLKYPNMFRTATVVVLNKIDLLPYVDFDLDTFRTNLAAVNSAVAVLPISATTGAGLPSWYAWLSER